MNGYSDYEFDEEDLAYEQSKLEHWRWCEELSVVEAAMLVIGMNPSTWEAETQNSLETGHFHRTGTTNNVKNYIEVSEFPPVFKAITRAVLAEKIPCQLAYSLPPEDARFWAGGLSPGEDVDWKKSLLSLESFRAWMEDKGKRPTFFFPSTDGNELAFTDGSHDHFSAELDLAVKAWTALASEQKFKSSPKAAIEAWIDANPGAWLGEGKISTEAKKRIATLVNWRKSGGAPSSGG